MPASLRWLGLLVVLAVVAAALSGLTLYRETATRTRIMAEALTGGNADAGRTAIIRYGCGSCHVIGGIHQATGTVGPALDGIGNRAEIAGHLPNQPAQMMLWLRHP